MLDIVWNTPFDAEYVILGNEGFRNSCEHCLIKWLRKLIDYNSKDW